MKRFTRAQIIVSTIAFLAALLLIVTPSIYLETTNTYVMGWVSTFGGTIRVNGGPIHVAFHGGSFTTFLLLIITILFTMSVGKTQKSVYIIDILLFIATGILALFHNNFFFVSYGAAGALYADTVLRSVGAYLCISFCIVGIIACIYAMIYKPDRRIHKHY